MTKATYVGIDVETSGLNPTFCEIVQIAACLIDADLNVVNRIVLHAFPERGMDERAAEINKYSHEEWTNRGAVTQKEMCAQLYSFLQGQERLIAIGHNVKFDIDFVRELFRRFNAEKDYDRFFSYHSIDTVTAAIILDLAKNGGMQGSYKLTKLTDRFNIDLGAKAHDAEADINATLELLKFLINGIRGDAPMPVAQPSASRGGGRKSLLEQDPVTKSWVFQKGKYLHKTAEHAAKDDITYIRWVAENVHDIPQEAKDLICALLQTPPSSV